MHECEVQIDGTAPRDRAACLRQARTTGVLRLHEQDASITLGGGPVRFFGLEARQGKSLAAPIQQRSKLQEAPVDFESRVNTYLEAGLSLDDSIDKAASEHPAEFRAWDRHLRGTLAENPDIVEESAKLAAEDPRSGKR